MLSNLLKTTELVGGWVRIWTQVDLLQNLSSLFRRGSPAVLSTTLSWPQYLEVKSNLSQAPKKK